MKVKEKLKRKAKDRRPPALKDKTDNRYTVLNSSAVELQLVYKEQLVKALIDREDYARVKAHHWKCRACPQHEMRIGLNDNADIGQSLQNFIFNSRAARFDKIPKDRDGRFDYRKASLSATNNVFMNTYRFLNSKKVELRVARFGKEIRIIFDREDYERVKVNYWRIVRRHGRDRVIGSGTKVPLISILLKTPLVRVKKTPVDSRGRLDYRKKTLVPLAGGNYYRKIDNALVEMRFYFKDELIRVLIDAQDREKVSAHQWRGGNHLDGRLSIKNARGVSLHACILGKKGIHIPEILRDEQGRLDYRKKSLLSLRNTYRVLTKTDMLLQIQRKGKTIEIRFDREDYQRIKRHDWRARLSKNNKYLVSAAKSGLSLAKVILNNPSIKITKIPMTSTGRLDYRKDSLLTIKTTNYTNTYRFFNQKEVELLITENDQKFRIIFDREDYERIKQHHWRVIKKAGGKGSSVYVRNTKGISLTKRVLKNHQIYVKTPPADSQGRLDYRKASLLKADMYYTNTYRFLNQKEVELLVANGVKRNFIVFDREDYERVKQYHWRVHKTAIGTLLVKSKTGVPLTKLVMENHPERIKKIRKIPVDSQGRLDHRKASLLSAAFMLFENTYRFVNEKEVELHIANKELEFRIIFDREDYERVKQLNWRGVYNKTGTATFKSRINGSRLSLTALIFKDRKVSVSQIPMDGKGRFDYRKSAIPISGKNKAPELV